MSKMEYKSKRGKDIVLLMASAEHWKNMIDWASQQPYNEPVDYHRMEVEIGQSWSLDGCPLCNEYIDKECKGCPIQEDGECCIDSNISPWEFVSHSPTWGVWVANATFFVRYLEVLISRKMLLTWESCK